MVDRLHHIDIAKGISIVLVVANHSAFRAAAPEFFNATSSLRLPLFFFLSGIFFNTKWSAEEFTLRKADALLKPYLVTLLALQLFWWLLGSASKHDVVGIFYASGMTIELMPLWFLPHLFLVHMAAFWLVRRFGVDTASVPAALALVVLGFLMGALLIRGLDATSIQVRNDDDARVGWPLSADVLLMSLAFFLAGFLLRYQIRSFTPKPALVVVFIVAFFAIAMIGRPYLDFNGRILMQPLLVAVSAIISVYCVLAFSYWLAAISSCRRALVRIGQAGLIILVFHSFFVGSLYRLLLPYLEDHPLAHGVSVCLIFLLGILGPLYIDTFIRRVAWLRWLYLPLPFGRTRAPAPIAP